jgi:hypothetical protein
MASGKAISLDDFRKRREKEKSEEAIPGVLVWLSCPECSTVEYTEIAAPYGRSHKCGAQVKEIQVNVDLRAEYTITRLNLELIDDLLGQNKKNRLIKLVSRTLDNALVSLKKSEETYIERLLLAAKGPLESYPGSIDDLKTKLPIKEINKLGMLISDFRHEPEKRFNEN